MRYFIFALILLFLVAGCTMVSPSKPNVYLQNVTGTRIHYNWYEVKGFVVNDDHISHSVSGYVDFYDENKVKFDHCLFFVDVDAHGKSSFDIISTKAEKITGTYEYYIDWIR